MHRPGPSRVVVTGSRARHFREKSSPPAVQYHVVVSIPFESPKNDVCWYDGGTRVRPLSCSAIRVFPGPSRVFRRGTVTVTVTINYMQVLGRHAPRAPVRPSIFERAQIDTLMTKSVTCTWAQPLDVAAIVCVAIGRIDGFRYPHAYPVVFLYFIFLFIFNRWESVFRA